MSRDRLESFKEFTRQNLLHAWPDRSETSFFSFFFSLIANDIVYIYTTNSNRGKARKRSQLIIHHFEQTICKTFAYNFFLHFLSFLQYPVVGIAIRNRFSGWHSASAYNSLSPTGRTSCSPTFYNVHCYFETRVHWIPAKIPSKWRYIKVDLPLESFLLIVPRSKSLEESDSFSLRSFVLHSLFPLARFHLEV